MAITPQEALDMGFATQVIPAVQSLQASASVQALVFQRLTGPAPEHDTAAMIGKLDGKLDRLMAALPRQSHEPPDRDKPKSFKDRLRAMKEKETTT